MLHLASQSPRRRELLARLGIDFAIVDLDVPEVRAAGESPAAYVLRVAMDKARAGLLRLAHDRDAVLLAADTEVVLDDRVFGKPADAADAVAMLCQLSGRTHAVLSAVVVASAGRVEHVVSRTAVTFAALDRRRIERYVAAGDAMGKAGAYAIQGAAESFVTRLDGSHSGVMGLPLHATVELLRGFGIEPAYGSGEPSRTVAARRQPA